MLRNLNSGSLALPFKFKRCLPADAFFIAMRKTSVALFLIGVLVSEAVWGDGCDLPSIHHNSVQKVTIEKVIDGDTVRLSSGKLVRFIGINTPEIDHENGQSEPYAEQARRYLRKVFEENNNRAYLQVGQDKHDRYRRLLAHVFTLNRKNIQADLLRRGLGVWIVVPPNLSYLECYQQNERLARDKQKAVWSKQFRIPRDTKSLTDTDRGFQWIQCKIQRIGKGRKYWWLNFEDKPLSGQRTSKFSKVTLRVAKDDLHYFNEMPVEKLVNKTVRVRGWLGRYKKQLVMSLRHPASIEVVDSLN